MIETCKKLWIFNHYATGDGDRHDSLACWLAKQGWEVVVVASSYNHSTHEYRYKSKCHIDKRSPSITYVWLRTSPAYTNNGLGRILNMISFYRLIKKYAKELSIEFGVPNCVIGSSAHPFVWEAAINVANRFNAHFYAELRDLWPLSLIEVQGVNPKHPIVLFFRILENRAYKKSTKIITTMPFAYKYISGTLGFERDKVVWIPNGIDIKRTEAALKNPNNRLPDELNDYLEKNWCAIYAGSIVKSECIDYILSAAEILQNKGMDNIKFAIVGDGHFKNQMISIVKQKNLKNVRFFSKISKDKVAIAVRKSNVCVAAVKNLSIYNYGLSVNKLNDYLYSGNPTVFVSDALNVVEQSGGGITVPFGNPELLSDSIEKVYKMTEDEKKLMTSKGRAIIESTYDTKIIADKLKSILELNLTNADD